MKRTKEKPQYHTVLYALLKFKKVGITALAEKMDVSRMKIMRILLDPKTATGYDREGICNVLHVTTRFLDGVITGNIPEDTKHFQELYILQENMKAETEQAG